MSYLIEVSGTISPMYRNKNYTVLYQILPRVSVEVFVYISLVEITLLKQ